MSNPIKLKDTAGALANLKRFVFPDTEQATAPVMHGPDGVPVPFGTGADALDGSGNGSVTAHLRKIWGALAGLSGLKVGGVDVSPTNRVPVDIGGASVSISGPVTVSNEVEIQNGTGNPIPTKPQPGVAATQSYVAVPAYSATDTTGAAGSNATIVQVLPANASRTLLKIVNRGGVDAELWYAAAKPQTVTVGRGDLAAAGGGGGVFDVAVPTGPIFATAASATGLSVLEG